MSTKKPKITPSIGLSNAYSYMIWFPIKSNKFMTRAKVSCYLQFLHKSIVVANVASSKCHTCKSKYWPTMEGNISLNKVLWEGETNLGSNFNANLHFHKFSNVFKRKNPLTMKITRYSKFIRRNLKINNFNCKRQNVSCNGHMWV